MTAARVCAEPNATLRHSETPAVTVVAPQCNPDAFPLVAFLDALRVELAGRGLRCCTLADRRDPAPTLGTLRLTIESVPCADDADRVQIKALLPGGQRSVQREIALSDVAPSTRPRALALAAAELIRSIGQAPLEASLVAAPVKVPPKHTAQPLPPAPSREMARTEQFAMHLQAELRSFSARETTFRGARARLSAYRYGLQGQLDWGADYCNVQVQLGDLHLRSASIGLGLGPRLVTQTAIMDLGIRAELGLAWIRGSTALSDVSTRSGSILFSNLGLRAALEVPAKWEIRPDIALEAGGVVRSAQGEVNGQPVAGIAGYYLTAAIGIAVPL